MATDVDIQKLVQHHPALFRGGGSRISRSRPVGTVTSAVPPEKREAIEEALRHFGMI
jgi:hypothetical protein